MSVLGLLGLLGTVLGLVLLGVGLLRAQIGPRWVPYGLWGFLVVEFVGSSLVSWGSIAAAALLATSMGGLAVTAWRTGGLAYHRGRRRDHRPGWVRGNPKARQTVHVGDDEK